MYKNTQKSAELFQNVKALFEKIPSKSFTG